MGFVERHGLRDERGRDAAARLPVEIEGDDTVDVIRLGFVDLHGVVRGKTIARTELAAALADGWGFPSSLMLKDTSHSTVYPVFSSDASQVPAPDYLGIGDLLMIPDPTTFRVLPWAHRTGWMLCDVVHKSGRRSPLCSRSAQRAMHQTALGDGLRHIVGPEIECHIFAVAGDGSPRRLNDGYQYLTEQRFDDLEPILEPIRRQLDALGLPLRSIEVEFGPSQIELTLPHGDAATVADDVILLRSAVKQICRRNGHHATFMCRPLGDDTMASGWHLHQSLERRDGSNAFAPDTGERADSGAGAGGVGSLSEVGRHFLGGLLAHAPAATALANPTINGYRRLRPNSLAPNRVAWGFDNRSAMLRVVGEGSGVHIENRVGEPAANPYLFIGSQLVAGLAGIERATEPPGALVSAYESDAPELPRSLPEALDALAADTTMREGLGAELVDVFTRIKRAEVARFDTRVTQWEHDEYFELF